MKLTTFCKILGRTTEWGYWCSRNGKIKLSKEKPYLVNGISIDLYFKIKSESKEDEQINEMLEYMKNKIYEPQMTIHK